MADISELIPAEIRLINKMLAAHEVQARTAAKLTMCVKSSFIAYGLQIAQGESVAKIERIQRELSNELTRQRVHMMPSYSGKAIVRVRDFPLALEVPHPSPIPLSWERANMRTGRYVALVGRSYNFGQVKEEYLDLERHYHTLVAAMSGGGKSTLMRMALLTLAQNTPPANLQVMLVDLKNDDLVPFQALPHCINYAGDIESAAAAIEYVHSVKTQRIQTQDKPYRLLLVIDELAELGADKEAVKRLGSILSTGRSLGINVIAGTQYPTAATIGSVVNASFTVRIVGMVDGKEAAHTATKRAKSGAELLCTPGDFLRVDGAELTRMKAYDITQDDSTAIIKHIARRTKGSPEEQKPLAIAAPQIPPKRSEAEEHADRLTEMFANRASKNAMAKFLFDKPYGGSHAAKIDAAIAILQLRSSKEASSASSPPPSSIPSSASSHTSEETDKLSSRRSETGDNKIIPFPRKAG